MEQERRDGRRAAWLVTAWTVVALLEFVAQLISQRPQKPIWERQLLLDLVIAWSWAALTPVVMWLARRRFTGKYPTLQAVGFHLIAACSIMMAFAALRTVLDGVILHMYGSAAVPKVLWTILMTGDLDTVLYFVIVGITRAADQLREYQDRTLRAAALEAELSGAQLRYLERQLQPHFLFNCLHVISELAYEAPIAARHIIADLQSLLRSAVARAGRDEVPLGEELDTLAPYVDIQRARFSEWLTITTDVDAEARRALMPPFVLQPLVENAIRHGLTPRGGPGMVGISARVEGPWLSIRVRDDGVGLPKGPAANARRHGIGLKNVRERLRFLYGPEHWFSLGDNPGGGTCVDIRIPYRLAVAINGNGNGHHPVDAAPPLPPPPEFATTEEMPVPPVPVPSYAQGAPSPPLTGKDWAFLGAGWALFGTFWYMQPYLGALPFPRMNPVREMLSFSPLNIAMVLVWAALTPAVIGLARRVRVGVGDGWRPVVFHVIGAVVFSAVQTGTIIALDVQPRAFRFSQQPQSLIWNLFVYAALVAWSNGRDYYAWRRERELESLRLEGAIMRARWRSLCVNLRPDFVCESLDVISALIDDDPAQAERLTTRLADLLRLTLDTAAEAWLPLSRELKLLAAYVDLKRSIETGRGCIHVQVDGAQPYGERRIPNRLLRALLEDAGPAAVKIDVSQVPRGTRIAVSSDRPMSDAAEMARLALLTERVSVRVVDPHEVVFVIDNPPGGV
ncbi:MAG TPA: histidine kinase [Gemmatimonadaceae bacterium]|nr:histidine kinase [Gemmatimonadaceae bacterium]